MDPNQQYQPQPVQPQPLEQQTPQTPVQPIEAQQTPIQPAQSISAQAPAVLYQAEVWYSPPSGGRSIFTSKKSRATVFQGWIVVNDLETGQEYNRIQISPDATFRNLMGSAAITRLNGRKIGAFEVGYTFTFYNPMLMLLSYLFMFSASSKSREFVAACNAAKPQMTTQSL